MLIDRLRHWKAFLHPCVDLNSEAYFEAGVKLFKGIGRFLNCHLTLWFPHSSLSRFVRSKVNFHLLNSSSSMMSKSESWTEWRDINLVVSERLYLRRKYYNMKPESRSMTKAPCLLEKHICIQRQDVLVEGKLTTICDCHHYFRDTKSIPTCGETDPYHIMSHINGDADKIPMVSSQLCGVMDHANTLAQRPEGTISGIGSKTIPVDPSPIRPARGQSVSSSFTTTRQYQAAAISDIPIASDFQPKCCQAHWYIIRQQ
jgi:hypothetical protein